MKSKTTTYVQAKTVQKGVKGTLARNGESKLCRIGKHKVIVTGSGRDKQGRQMHTATLIKENGRLGESYRARGPIVKVVSRALKKNGVEVKRPKK